MSGGTFEFRSSSGIYRELGRRAWAGLGQTDNIELKRRADLTGLTQVTAAIASGSWLPLDLEGSEVRQRPVPCQLERIRRRLEAGHRSMRITDASTGAVVFETQGNPRT